MVTLKRGLVSAPRGIIGPDICTAGRRSSVSGAAALHSLCPWSSKAAIRPKKFAANETQQIESMRSVFFVFCFFYLTVKNVQPFIYHLISYEYVCLTGNDSVSVLFRQQIYISAADGF